MVVFGLINFFIFLNLFSFTENNIYFFYLTFLGFILFIFYNEPTKKSKNQFFKLIQVYSFFNFLNKYMYLNTKLKLNFFLLFSNFIRKNVEKYFLLFKLDFVELTREVQLNQLKIILKLITKNVVLMRHQVLKQSLNESANYNIGVSADNVDEYKRSLRNDRKSKRLDTIIADFYFSFKNIW